ncbi:MAG: ABC transporter ATP-binding protein [Chloroflexota bacterium]
MTAPTDQAAMAAGDSNAVAAATAAIYTDGLSKQYGRTVALAGLSMGVPRGEVFGFLGPNGAGKTTAVKLLVGLAKPTAGDAFVLGARAGDREVRRRIGYLPELFRYQDWLSAREVLNFHYRLAGLPQQGQDADATEALALVGLAARGDDRVSGFSKGMQQRLGLAVALLGRPELVLLDEPTSALDPVGRHDVREIIRRLKARGTAVFLNSHLLSEVEQVCDRVAIVNKGRVIALGTMAAVLGVSSSVRIRVTGLEPAILADLSRFGAVQVEASRLTVRGIDEDAVPDLVVELLRLGGRVYAVEPRHETLEDRFLQLLKGAEGAGPDDRPLDHA